MKKLITILFVLCFGVTLWAQQKGQPRLSPEEFRNKQEAFITKKAELTKDEAAKFFPVFFELQDKKKKLNDKVWELIKKGKQPDTTEAQYENIIDEVLNSRIKADELEKEYYNRFKKILSAKKVYKIQNAEMRFHRELLKGMNKECPPNRK